MATRTRTRTHRDTHTCLLRAHTCTHTHTHAHAHARTRTRTRTRTHTHAHTRTDCGHTCGPSARALRRTNPGPARPPLNTQLHLVCVAGWADRGLLLAFQGTRARRASRGSSRTCLPGSEASLMPHAPSCLMPHVLSCKPRGQQWVQKKRAGGHCAVLARVRPRRDGGLARGLHGHVRHQRGARRRGQHVALARRPRRVMCYAS